MPSAQHPQAKFDPIPPDLDLPSLVDRTPNFRWAQRVSRSQIRSLGQQDFEKLVAIHVIAGGKPLVIEGWDAALPPSLFSVGWLESAYDKKQENVRDISNAVDIPMTTGHYLRSMKQLTNQWTQNTYRDERRQRLYLKDIDCPVEWRDMLQKIINPNLFYLNENVTSKGGKRMPDEEIFENETTAASAGDLMSSLPEEMRAQNLMCYIGHEGTYTPAHREMCASLGQNIMVEASRDENGEKKGSSIWFMTESKDREVVREYFLSMLGHDIEIEKHFAQINAWKKAPFDVYIVEQCVGDFILIPPLAAHQVWNRGTRTMKVAWNRTTVDTLDLALHEALPKARLVCRDEQYKNKAVIYYTLQKYYTELQKVEKKAQMVQTGFMGFERDVSRSSPRVKQLAADFKKLLELFTEILVDEVFAFKEKDVEFLPFDSCVTCSYCRSNIFNRFLTCKHCIRSLPNGEEDAYDVCMECYAMGRSCACLSGLRWCEQWSWSELADCYESWKATVISMDGHVDLECSPQPLEIARQRAGKKSLAQICQEALRRRPWKDITKSEREKTPSDSEQGDGDDKPNKKSKRKKKKGEVHRCHVCCHPDYSYRVHLCTNPGCVEGYCYGVLYRAFDLTPQAVLEDEHWQCPKCLGICNCGHCRRAGNTRPYMPKNTSLGHDTRRIADDRSVEALVDFRIHNLSWLKAAGEESRSKDSKRMQLLREQADNAKAQDVLKQAQVEPRMQPSAVFATNLGESSAVNGYGDQSQVLGRDRGNSSDHSFDVSNSHIRRVDNVPQGIAAPIVTKIGESEGVDSSQYPDPSVFGRQRIGMGYYEQDDTPDKILFDPYQAPSTDSMKANEPVVPEFVKKSVRAAKRKAKRENEDPDFIVPKSHQKKPRLFTESSDFLENMDPALFADGNSSAMLNQTAARASMDSEAATRYLCLGLTSKSQACGMPSHGPLTSRLTIWIWMN
ncbi:domain containing [Trichoderma cornu-damae]|uniref:Domain containing n=1 Tax=Trichoderma cornu-damae TaxID=654480 RepID=A0A9P8QWG9_9HYPO|nr:domain containing [Trichoderma cornu-damae]